MPVGLGDKSTDRGEPGREFRGQVCNFTIRFAAKQSHFKNPLSPNPGQFSTLRKSLCFSLLLSMTNIYFNRRSSLEARGSFCRTRISL